MSFKWVATFVRGLVLLAAIWVVVAFGASIAERFGAIGSIKLPSVSTSSSADGSAMSIAAEFQAAQKAEAEAKLKADDRKVAAIARMGEEQDRLRTAIGSRQEWDTISVRVLDGKTLEPTNATIFEGSGIEKAVPIGTGIACAKIEARPGSVYHIYATDETSGKESAAVEVKYEGDRRNVDLFLN